MKLLVTGSTGYIGRRLVDRLAGEHLLVALTEPDDATELPGHIHRIADPGSAVALADELRQHAFDAVIHLAACQSTGHAPIDSDRLTEANLSFAARVLASACEAGVRGVVLAGTYWQHADGTADYVPNTLYAATKQAATDLALFYRRRTSLRAVVLELSDIYGPADPRPKFLGRLDAARRSGEPLEATPGTQLLAPLHVDDAVAAFAHAATLLAQGVPLDAAYAVAGPELLTLRDLFERYCQVTGGRPDVRWGVLPFTDSQVMRPHIGPSLPGWRPAFDLDDGLADVYGRDAS